MYMKFWKRLMENIEKIADRNLSTSTRLKGILSELGSLNNMITESHLKLNDISNDNPIKEIKSSPLLLLEYNSDREKLIIQNIGLEPCYIKLDSEISKENYHFVLAPDTSLHFGNGGSITLDNWHGEVYAICEKETKLSVLEY